MSSWSVFDKHYNITAACTHNCLQSLWKKLKLEMFDVISKHTWQWSSDDFEWDKIFMIWSSRRDRGTFAEPSRKSTSAKFWIRKRERAWSQLFKTSKIFKKLLLTTKLWCFEKSSIFFLVSHVQNHVNLRSDNDIWPPEVTSCFNTVLSRYSIDFFTF